MYVVAMGQVKVYKALIRLMRRPTETCSKKCTHPDPYLTSLVSQMVKGLPTMWEAWAQSLGREDLLEKEIATHSSILAWKIPWTEEPGRLQSMGSELDMTEQLHFSLLTF